eukprot:Cvel_28623.t1-p1 / transcript=Cvel_28623.t1 / gene=Cvel_28623 / organism=Chromera_velia_CCMP2878 / gene_product=hypothetical protein / transcript_product=hypothetical protein / location=Cvel_scaffold3779:331-1456(-) / protein_length=115 / sequence_SO=supercontig / SO=protein_coding / is_pseudo=false
MAAVRLDNETGFFLKKSVPEGQEEAEEVRIPVTCSPGVDGSVFPKVFESKKFQNWANKYAEGPLTLKSIDLKNVTMFGDKVGFVTMDADVTRPDGTNVPVSQSESLSLSLSLSVS